MRQETRCRARTHQPSMPPRPHSRGPCLVPTVVSSTLVAARCTWSAPTIPRLVIGDATAGIEIELATDVQLVLECLAAPLHPGFHAGDRDSRASGGLVLRQSLQVNQPDRLTVEWR